jgi:hypothetical protein
MELGRWLVHELRKGALEYLLSLGLRWGIDLDANGSEAVSGVLCEDSRDVVAVDGVEGHYAKKLLVPYFVPTEFLRAQRKVRAA